MPPRRLATFAGLALLGFAGNSLLCRAALRGGGIDAASFTSLRLAAGAFALAVLASWRAHRAAPPGDDGGPIRPAFAGDWTSALALFAYAALFSLAYTQLSAGAGALLLFGAVQVTMLAQGWREGDQLRGLRALGAGLAVAGLLLLLLPGAQAPALVVAAMMLGAGIAWGVYTLRGRRAGDALARTAGNFARTLPMAAALWLATPGAMRADAVGIACAVASGALASGVGYALWYAALPALRASTAATLQLAVPVLAALGGVALLGEQMTARLAGAAVIVVAGIGLVLRQARPD
jgi:drug/metabolite transporter (DMT)-like permease